MIIFKGIRTLRGHWNRAGWGLIAAGILLVVLADVVGWEWTRIFGALSVSAGGTILGVLLGLGPDRRWPLGARLRSWGRILGIAAAVIVALPLIVVLAAAMAGLGSLSGGSVGAGLIGGLIAVLMLLATLAALATSVYKIAEANRAIVDRDLHGAPDPQSR